MLVTYVVCLSEVWHTASHWTTGVAFPILMFFPAASWVLFIAASRIAVHRFHLPAVAAIPVCWSGAGQLLEWSLGGSSVGRPEHTLYLQPLLLQTADLAGGQLVGALIVALGCGLGTFLSFGGQRPGRRDYGFAVAAIAAVLAALVYGAVRLADQPEGSGPPVVRVAALQGDKPVGPELRPDLEKQAFERYLALAAQASGAFARDGARPDLVVWPETVIPLANLVFENGGKPADLGFSEEQVEKNQAVFVQLARHFGAPQLFGVSTRMADGKAGEKHLNSALYVNPEDQGIGPRYDKIHLLVFGEYLPFAKHFSVDFPLQPFGGAMDPGDTPVAVKVGGYWAAVNICNESTNPSYIREQIAFLKAKGTPPELLVNLSNNGWFRFAPQTDLHVATHVFRAVENRLPYVAATNGGFSALIDSKGRIRQIGSRAQEGVVAGALPLDGFDTLYSRIGNWPWVGCAVVVVALIVFRKRQTVGGGLRLSERNTAVRRRR